MERIKRHKQNNFTVIDNHIFRQKNISYKAKGFLATVMSLPEDWDFSIQGMAKNSKEGRDAILSTIKELIKHGYCNKIQIREEGKFQGVEYQFFERPEDNKDFNHPKQDKPNTENPFTDKPNTENQLQLNTYSIKYLSEENKEEIHVQKENFEKEISSSSSSQADEVVNDAVDLLRTLTNTNKGKKPSGKEVRAKYNQLVMGKDKVSHKEAREFILAHICLRVIEWHGTVWSDGTNAEKFLTIPNLFGTNKFIDKYLNGIVLTLKKQSLDELKQQAFLHVGLSADSIQENAELGLQSLLVGLCKQNYQKRLDVVLERQKKAKNNEEWAEANQVLSSIKTQAHQNGWFY